MKPIDDIRAFIRESLAHDECIDATEIAELTQKLHPQYSVDELVSTVIEQRSLMRELQTWPNAGPHSL